MTENPNSETRGKLMHSRIQRQLHTFRKGAAVAALLGASILSAAPSHADVRSSASWQCDGGRVNVPSNPDYYTAFCKKGSSSVKVNFYPNAGSRTEYLRVYDSFDNDHKTVAYLSVKGEGTARFTTGKYTRDYPEGRDAALRVCTSGSSKAVCSGWEDGGTT